MPGKMEISSQLEIPAGWDEFVAGHPAAKVYHSSSWCHMIEEVFGHRTNYIVARLGSDIRAVLPLTSFKSMLFGNLAISLPYINYGGPLLSNGTDHHPLFGYLQKFRREGNYKSVEIRLDERLETDLPCKTHKVTFFLDLPEDPDELMNSFKAKIRSQIRRPAKENMYAAKGQLELLDDFYQVFTINMRDLGTPPLPKQFFRRILEIFPEKAYIVVVYSAEGEVAAASFLICHRDMMEIPWASSIRKFNRLSPNMMLYWESFSLSIEKGCRLFDFGRCSPDGGTYRFKKQWGARESQLHWYYVLPDGQDLPEISPQNSKYDLMIKVWQKLPLGVTKRLGPQLIKHIP